MRRFFFIITAFSALLLSCGKQPEPVVEPQPLPFSFDGNLLRIDSLMQHDADSALVLLLDKACLVPTGCDELSRNANACLAAADVNDDYRSLLLSEALYKTGNAQLNRFRCETFQETSLQEAVRCFDSLAAQYPGSDDIVVLSARAHYMNGVGFYENDSVVEACREYLKTLEIMENRFDESELVGYKAKFMGLTYTRLGEVYFYNGIADASLYSRKKALACFKRLENYDLANTFRSVGGAYLLDHQNDSALFYYRKAIDLSLKQNNLMVYCYSLSEAASIYYDLGYTDSAFIMMRNALSIPVDEEHRLIQYFTFGLLFEKERLLDSAIVYYKKSLNSNNYNTRTASEEKLGDCYHALGDTTNELFYKLRHNESLRQFVDLTPDRIKIKTLFENHKLNKIEKQNQSYIKQKRRFDYFILSFISLFIAFVLALSHYNHRKKNRTIFTMRQKIKANSFIDEPICKYILKTVDEKKFKSHTDYALYTEFALSSEQIKQLREAVDTHFNNITKDIKEQYDLLNDDDINYCCLYILGIKDADISALMQRSYRAVCDRNKKLKSVFKTKESVNSFLCGIINKQQLH